MAYTGTMAMGTAAISYFEEGADLGGVVKALTERAGEAVARVKRMRVEHAGESIDVAGLPTRAELPAAPGVVEVDPVQPTLLDVAPVAPTLLSSGPDGATTEATGPSSRCSRASSVPLAISTPSSAPAIARVRPTASRCCTRTPTSLAWRTRRSPSCTTG
jgi:hypothetical protein